ncbi:MAG: type I DNA topoisomerase, partial [Duncaniella sp.]|nr:type I DNA topoisomerase [Duncaniella sp.]
MLKNLVIVESPAKAKTIEKFLGKDFKVMSSYGHIRDLRKKDISIDLDNDFAPVYEIPSDKKELVKELKKAASQAETVWLASDEDREGEAISWHLFEVLGLKKENTKRIVFHEITKDAIIHAIENPRDIDINLVDAQQARRVLDRLVGFELSPVLWKKIKPALSAGRVQSVAVRLIVDRENEINNFKSEPYYRVTARFNVPGGSALKAELSKRLPDETAAREFLEACAGATYRVSDINVRPLRKSPAPPFTTSTLQQEASRKLGFTVSQTMMIAQKLYEAGYITYMRTDSLNLSSLAIGTISKLIKSEHGEQYLHIRKFHTSSKGAQEAHEAIRPTYIDKETIEGTDREKKLYRLIRLRTIASQMADAEIEKTTIDIVPGDRKEHFTATGEVIKFDGFLKVYLEGNDDESDTPDGETALPRMSVGETLTAIDVTAAERYTLQPPRYTEASLVKKMEELGIGRPSTYAPTISTIQNREYVEKGEKPGVK